MCYLPETNIILQVTYTRKKKLFNLKFFFQYYCFCSLGGHDRNCKEYKRNELGGDEGEWKETRSVF